MVHLAMTTLMMAGEEQPVFHDFLGMSCNESVIKQTDLTRITKSRISRSSPGSAGFEVEIDGGETSAKASMTGTGLHDTPALLTGPLALVFPSCSDPGSERQSWSKSEGLQTHGTKSAFYKPDADNRSAGKKRDDSTSSYRDSLQDKIQVSSDALESSRGNKMSRFESKNDKRGRLHDDDLHLAMQPPRPTSTCQTLKQPSICTKSDIMAPKKWERPVSFNTGPTGQTVYGPSRLSQLGGGYTEKNSANVFRENATMPPLPDHGIFLSRPAADEGSRTGLQTSGLGNLVNGSPSTTAGRNAGGAPGLLAGRTKLISQSVGPEFSIPSSHQIAAPASRQLTIFYGGEAHVFDDVHPDKAEAIMALAGSNGRSWSTTYSPRPRSSLQTSSSEGYVSVLGREKAGNRMTAVNGANSLGLFREMHSLLPAIPNPIHGSSRLVQSASMEDPNCVQPTSENKPVPLGGNDPRPFACANQGDKEASCHGQQLV